MPEPQIVSVGSDPDATIVAPSSAVIVRRENPVAITAPGYTPALMWSDVCPDFVSASRASCTVAKSSGTVALFTDARAFPVWAAARATIRKRGAVVVRMRTLRRCAGPASPLPDGPRGHSLAARREASTGRELHRRARAN